MSKEKKQTYFSDSWLTDKNFSNWIAKAPDKTKARCKLCCKNFKLSNMGVGSLDKHANGDTHKKKMVTSNEVKNFFSKSVKRPTTVTNLDPNVCV